MKDNVMCKLKNQWLKSQNQILAAGAVIASAYATALPMVYAADAKSLMETVIKIIAVLLFIPAAILSVTGIVAYASAHSEGDRPAQKKAVNTLSAGIMLAALGVILKASASTFSSLVSTSP